MQFYKLIQNLLKHKAKGGCLFFHMSKSGNEKKSKFFTGFAKKMHILTTNMEIFTS